MGSESDDIDAGWDEVPVDAAAPSAAAYVPSESLSPSEVTALPPRVEHGPVSRFAPIAAVVALAAASIVWLGRTPALAPPRPVAAAQPASQPVPPPAPAPLPPADERPVESAVAPPKATTQEERLELEPLVLEASRKSGVSVRSIPDGAIFFEAGKRLGTGTIQVNVARDGNVHLTALLNGYRPLNFKVDGSRDSVTVRLTPVGEPPLPATETAAVPAPAQ